MIVFEIHCNFFIVLPTRLKACRSVDLFFFVFYKTKYNPLSPPKKRARLRGLARSVFNFFHLLFLACL